MKYLFLSAVFGFSVFSSAETFNMRTAMKEMKSHFKCLASGGFLCKSDSQEVQAFQVTLDACDQNIESYFKDLVANRAIPQMPPLDKVHQAFAEIRIELQKINVSVQTGNTAARQDSLKNVKTIMEAAHDAFRPELE